MKFFIRILVCVGIIGFLGCSTKQRVGEVFHHDEDPCHYKAPTIKISLERKEFFGESKPEEARIHSWDTAVAEATTNCKMAGYKICKHLDSKDKKMRTGKTSGPGQYYYQVSVVGERVVETPRSLEEIQADQTDHVCK